jgi:hypothetical protein
MLSLMLANVFNSPSISSSNASMAGGSRCATGSCSALRAPSAQSAAAALPATDSSPAPFAPSGPDREDAISSRREVAASSLDQISVSLRPRGSNTRPGQGDIEPGEAGLEGGLPLAVLSESSNCTCCSPPWLASPLTRERAGPLSVQEWERIRWVRRGDGLRYKHSYASI